MSLNKFTILPTSTMRKLKPAAFVVAALAATTLLASSAMAACKPGALCIWDRDGNNQKIEVYQNNNNWAVFGWNNRADEFFNNGRYKNVCIYTGYSHKGLHRLIRRGYHFKPGFLSPFKNNVSSNKWTPRSGC